MVLGIYYARARIYDAEGRRFMAVDPVMGDIKDPQSLVQYTYCLNNPLKYVDPTGLRAIVVDGKPEFLSDNTWSHTGRVWIRELARVLNDNSISASIPIYHSTHSVTGTINGRYYEIDLKNLPYNIAGGAISGVDVSSYFVVLFCGDQSKTYVHLTQMMAMVGLSNRVMWLSPSLEDKLTISDVEKGTRVSIVRGTQYLDVTIPVNNAVIKDESTFANKKVPMDASWFISQVEENGVWDIKYSNRWKGKIETTYPGAWHTEVVFQSEIVNPKILGNMTYGYLGSAMGWSSTALLEGGHYAAGGNSIRGIFTRADDAVGQTSIMKGVRWYYDVRGPRIYERAGD